MTGDTRPDGPGLYWAREKSAIDWTVVELIYEQGDGAWVFTIGTDGLYCPDAFVWGPRLTPPDEGLGRGDRR